MIFKKTDNRGFTLIELLIVIAIIGLLSTLAIAALKNAQAKSRDIKRIADIRQLMTALELYYDQNKIYPISSWLNSSDAAWLNNSNVLATALAPYLSKLPIDPKNEAGYAYSGVYTYSYFSSNYGASGQWYMIVYRLEDGRSILQTKDGVRACNGSNFHYGNNSNGVLTVGRECQI
ncbi:prepilin-type N-terminal cleavage/methylation domain-containing protein [Candidatus Kuenenbacteria bacterium]|nr:prepilin-type N-terminal cleavage/methylation domain-containing protein [Candidatus Kuenenbacteria bacterium]